MSMPAPLNFHVNSVSVSGATFTPHVEDDSGFIDFELHNPIDDLLSPTWEDIGLTFTDLDAGA